MGKYQAFYDYFEQNFCNDVSLIELNFFEVESILGFELPAHLRKFVWANDKTSGFARSWLSSGYKIIKCDLKNEKVSYTRVNEIGKQNSSKIISKKRRTIIRTDIEKPSEEEMEYYLSYWENLENYKVQEDALYKLFHTTYPNNTEIEDILVKVTVLNVFYSTNIFKVYNVAKRIHDLNIDERLRAYDPTLVDDIAEVHYNNGVVKHNYSFATKYCSHHFPTEYPIYDSYIEKVLIYFRDKDNFSEFDKRDLRNYSKFKKILLDFRDFYNLNKYTLKQLDQYLWQLGKDKFPKNYSKSNKK